MPALYAPKPGDFHVVEIPDLPFLMIDGHGNPHVSPAYAEAVHALFTLSYAVPAIARSELARVHVVGPSKGCGALRTGPRVFVAGDNSAWEWTMAISQPAWITHDIIQNGNEAGGEEGSCGARPFALRAVHGRHERTDPSRRVLRLRGTRPRSAPRRVPPEARPHVNGKHHEVYLSDARRTDPAKLRTILRQPVASIS